MMGPLLSFDDCRIVHNYSAGSLGDSSAIAVMSTLNTLDGIYKDTDCSAIQTSLGHDQDNAEQFVEVNTNCKHSSLLSLIHI